MQCISAKSTGVFLGKKDVIAVFNDPFEGLSDNIACLFKSEGIAAIESNGDNLLLP